MCLAQGHNAVTLVRLKPAASWSRVKHSTTEPLRSPYTGNICRPYFQILMLVLETNFIKGA